MASLGPQLIALAELANLDAKGKQLRDKLESLPAAAKKGDETAKKISSDVDGVMLRKTTAETAKRSAELEMAEERQKIRKWEARANDVRGEREHAALSSEIGTAKRALRRLEEVVLEQMESIEGADKELATARKKQGEAEADSKSEWAKVAGDLDALRTELATIDARRSASMAKLPADTLKRYAAIAERRAGVGVAIILANDRCGACQRALPPQLSIQIQKGLALEGCPACFRLLVHHTMTAVEVING
jgi:uncharacterized protein